VSKLKEIKEDLGNYTENADQYIQAFREVSQNFEQSWKDVMLLLSQTLIVLEKQRVLDQAVKDGDNYHLDKCGPTGLSQTGPSQEWGEGEERKRLWIPKREPRLWTLKVARMNGAVTISSTAYLGLMRARVKPLHYSQVMAVKQGPLETPVAFLQRLKDALQKQTNIIPKSQEEEIILKDKFLTQSVPDIHKKLQKLVAEGSRDLDQLVHVATSIYCNRD
jgi:hypothetical protein